MSEQRQYQANSEVTVEVMSLAELQQKREGTELPFAALTRQNWVEVQERVPQCFHRFVTAIAGKQIDAALMASLEIQEIATQMLLEVYLLTAELELTSVENLNLSS